MSLKSEERKKELLRILNYKNKVTVIELKERLKVSGVTVRHDLTNLQKEGHLYRVHGGAIAMEKLEYEFPFQERLEKNLQEKKSIANAALSLIKERDAIFLDSGSTILELAKLLKVFHKLTVVTNSFPVLLELASVSSIKLIGIGGEVNPGHLAFSGSSTTRYLQDFYFDKVFLGTDGFSIEKGFMTDDLSIAEVERTAIKRAKEKIILADSTKIGSIGFTTTISSLKEIDLLVTDWGIKKRHLRDFQTERIRVIVAGKSEE